MNQLHGQYRLMPLRESILQRSYAQIRMGQVISYSLSETMMAALTCSFKLLIPPGRPTTITAIIITVRAYMATRTNLFFIWANVPTKSATIGHSTQVKSRLNTVGYSMPNTHWFVG